MMMAHMMKLSPIGSPSSENLEKRMMCAKPNWQREVARFVSSICMAEKKVGVGTGTRSIPEIYVMRQKYLRSLKFCGDNGEMKKTALRRTKKGIEGKKKNMQKMKGTCKFTAVTAEVMRRFYRAFVAKSDVLSPKT